MCDKTYQKTFLSVVYSGAIAFLKSSCFNDIMPFNMNVLNCNELVDSLYLNKDWCRMVIGIKGVKKYNVTAFFFQLPATKILSFKLVDKKVVCCVVSRDPNGKYLYKTVQNWEGLIFNTKKSRGRAVDFKDIVSAQKKAVEILDNY